MERRLLLNRTINLSNPSSKRHSPCPCTTSKYATTTTSMRHNHSAQIWIRNIFSWYIITCLFFNSRWRTIRVWSKYGVSSSFGYKEFGNNWSKDKCNKRRKYKRWDNEYHAGNHCNWMTKWKAWCHPQHSRVLTMQIRTNNDEWYHFQEWAGAYISETSSRNSCETTFESHGHWETELREIVSTEKLFDHYAKDLKAFDPGQACQVQLHNQSNCESAIVTQLQR